MLTMLEVFDMPSCNYVFGLNALLICAYYEIMIFMYMACGVLHVMLWSLHILVLMDTTLEVVDWMLERRIWLGI